ncbi:hypothetical protein [Massilia antarctica]|uniref:hypothetical protein n=1 Tax=Massilia antarctica TaxID=2765360 RepID=UPI002272267C|nr:hypothetical protein [Massilia sp. H27-R4]MCY0910881.1 hypothetical protein [Massilia sp. H27-R4]
MNTTTKRFPLSPDEVQLAMLIQLDQQTELLTNLCRHQDDEVKRQERCGAALSASLRTAEPMPTPPPPKYDWPNEAVRGRMSEESLKAEFARRGPVASDNTLVLLLAEVRRLRADLAESHGAQPMRTLSAIAEQSSDIGLCALRAAGNVAPQVDDTPIHTRWRVLPVHLIAKLLGVLVHIEGIPFGSSRTYLASPAGRPGVSGGALGQSESPTGTTGLA